QTELTRLLDPTAGLPELAAALDGVRLGLTAHAEAEDIVLGRCEHEDEALVELVLATRAAHLAQASALAALVTMRIGTAGWRDRIQPLRELVRYHHEQEAIHL